MFYIHQCPPAIEDVNSLMPQRILVQFLVVTRFPNSPLNLFTKNPKTKMAPPASQQYQLYRESSIGRALTDTLDELIQESALDPQTAMTVNLY